MNTLGVGNWSIILSKQPQLINLCNNVDNICENNWSCILSEQPNLEKYCNKFNTFDEDCWRFLLLEQPQFIDKCNKELSEEIKVDLLNKHPKLIEKINVDNINKEENFKVILYNSKEYRNKCIEKYIKKFNNKETLTNMIGIYPDLKDLYTENDLWKYVDFSKLNNFNEYRILI